jgi:type VI secretion system protein ImpE
MQDAAELLRQNELDAALAKLLEQVRADSANPKLRTFLFQLACVTGDWQRARTQLEIAAGMDSNVALMASTYSVALKGEEERQRVLSGEVTPTIFGPPEPWMAKLYEAWRFDAKGEHKAAAALRTVALEEAPATSGTIENDSFEWIADADSRLGPVLETIVNGRYFWMPFQRLSMLAVDPPTDLRDQVWMPARFTLVNEGETVGLIPTRYFKSEESKDPLVRLARKTDWAELAPECFAGSGQRMLVTEKGDYPLMDVRQIRFDPAGAATPNG